MGLSPENSVAVIVPKGNGGVADYANVFASRMRSENARDPTIVPLGRDFEDNSTVTKAKLYYLQYSGYGYQGRGVPYWLLQWVRERMEAGAVVGTFFHELYAFGPPWRSSFWLSPFQRDIAAKLAGASTFWLTNREASARWLAGAAGDKPNAVLPVFSNVGEQEILAGGKSNRGVVFGNEAARCAVYRTGGLELFAWADRHDVKIHDVGDPISDPVLSKRLDELGVVKHGRLAREEVHQMLCTAKVGFLKYPLAYITKSGMFAAYCSHGMCPIVLSPRPVNTDGLTEGVHYIRGAELLTTSLEGLDKIGKEAWAWYRAHRVQSHLDAFWELSRRFGCG